MARARAAGCLLLLQEEARGLIPPSTGIKKQPFLRRANDPPTSERHQGSLLQRRRVKACEDSLGCGEGDDSEKKERKREDEQGKGDNRHGDDHDRERHGDQEHERHGDQLHEAQDRRADKNPNEVDYDALKELVPAYDRRFGKVCQSAMKGAPESWAGDFWRLKPAAVLGEDSKMKMTEELCASACTAYGVGRKEGGDEKRPDHRLASKGPCFGYTYWSEKKSEEEKCELHRKLVTHTKRAEDGGNRDAVLCAVKLTEGLWAAIRLGWPRWWAQRAYAGERDEDEKKMQKDEEAWDKEFKRFLTDSYNSPKSSEADHNSVTAKLVAHLGKPWEAALDDKAATKSVPGGALAFCDEANLTKRDSAKFEYKKPLRSSDPGGDKSGGFLPRNEMEEFSTLGCGVLALFDVESPLVEKLDVPWRHDGDLTYRSCRSVCSDIVGCDLWSFDEEKKQCLLGRGYGGSQSCDGMWKKTEASGWVSGVCNRWATCGHRFGKFSNDPAGTYKKEPSCDFESGDESDLEFRGENICAETGWENAGGKKGCKHVCCVPKERGPALKVLFVGNDLTFGRGEAKNQWRVNLPRYVETVARGFGYHIEVDEDTVKWGIVHGHLPEILTRNAANDYTRPKFLSETGQVCEQHPLTDKHAPKSSHTKGALACPQKGLLRSAGPGRWRKNGSSNYTRSYYDIIQLQDFSNMVGLGKLAENFAYPAVGRYSKSNKDTKIAMYTPWSHRHPPTDNPKPDRGGWDLCGKHGLSWHYWTSSLNDGKHLGAITWGTPMTEVTPFACDYKKKFHKETGALTETGGCTCRLFPSEEFMKAALQEGLCWTYALNRGALFGMETQQDHEEKDHEHEGHGAALTIPAGLSHDLARGWGREKSKNGCFQAMKDAYYDEKMKKAGGESRAKSARAVAHVDAILNRRVALPKEVALKELTLFFDPIHPTAIAQYINALTFFAVVFNQDPTDCKKFRDGSYCGTLDNLHVTEEHARWAQMIVKYALTDWGVDGKWGACNFWADKEQCGKLHLKK